MSMIKMIADLDRMKAQVSEQERVMSERVSRVLNLLSRQKFDRDAQFNYGPGSSNHVLVGNHLWAQYFDEFSVDDRAVLSAGGMYQGSLGYYEHESVRFPVAWCSLIDEELIFAFQEAWANHQWKISERKRADTEAASLAREARDRREYERLKEKFDAAK